MDAVLKNIGIIEDATIKLDGLTVITGYNNTGKSSIGKALYSLISAVEDLQQVNLLEKTNYALRELRMLIDSLELFRYNYGSIKYDNSRIGRVFELLYRSPRMVGSVHFEDLDELIAFVKEVDQAVSELSLEMFDELFPTENGILKRSRKARFSDNLEKKESIRQGIQIVLQNIDADRDLQLYANKRIEKTLQTVFHGQIAPQKLKGKKLKSSIKLTENQKVFFDVPLENNSIVTGKETYHSSWLQEVVLVDDAYVLDNLTPRRNPRLNSRIIYGGYHSEDFLDMIDIDTPEQSLMYKLTRGSSSVFDSIVQEKNADAIFELISQAFSQTLIYHEGSYITGEEKLDVKNLATGTKVFAILKTLIQKGHISKDTFLILDEPEAHLHPDWQNLFAEIIVLLVKEIGVTILLTTHSANFMLALETMMRKYQIETKSNFYINRKKENGYMTSVECVNDCIDEIYTELVRPYAEMFELRRKISEPKE